MAPRALHSGLWVRRLVNFWVEGFANGGYPGLVRCLGSEVNDGTGQEGPDRLIRCLLDNAYQVWVERDRMVLYVANQIRSLPCVPCHSNGFQATQEITSCRICSRDRILRDL